MVNTYSNIWIMLCDMMGQDGYDICMHDDPCNMMLGWFNFCTEELWQIHISNIKSSLNQADQYSRKKAMEYISSHECRNSIIKLLNRHEIPYLERISKLKAFF